MLGKAVTRIASSLAAALLLVGLTAAGGHAQGTTGKIQGRVVSSTGQPIASAQVTVEGTTLGNITNDDGFYFINEVPAGLHSIRAQSIGYRSVVVSNQRMLGGQTLTQNFTLEQAAVELEALVVAGERNPLVPRDQVSSRSIVTGEQLDNAPIDNAASIVLLQPGVITGTCGVAGGSGARCVSIRGSRAGEEAVFVDGVPIRNMRNGEPAQVELPTNALSQVDVTTGGISARFGNAQAGVISYVTKSGSPDFGGAVSFMTDQLAPKDWRTYFNRGELSFGGPIPGIRNLAFFMGGTFEGNKYRALNSGYTDIPFLIPSGVDTTFRLARTSETGGAVDSVDVVVPNYVEWANGRTSPTRQEDEINFTARLSYGLGQGSKIDLSYLGNRDQVLARGHADLYNPDAWVGTFTTENVLTASGYFMLHQTAEQALALDLRASWQRDWFQTGTPRTEWLRDHLSPTLGFNVSNIEFVMDPADWEVNEDLINAVRSGALPPNALQLFENRSDLTKRQSVPGISSPLRLNPYGMREQWAFAGIGNQNQQFATEKRWYFSGSADWQMNRFNRLWIGGDATLGNTTNFFIPTYSGNTAVPVAYEPKIFGAYLQDRLDIGDVVIEAGLRLDHFRPDGTFPRVPGFVFNVPDSLRGDFVTLRPLNAGETDPEGRLGVMHRLQPLADCGGASTASRRTNADGQVVCKNNFIPAQDRTVFSPKLAVAFPVTATSTFRVSYGQNVQVPALTGTGGLFDFNYRDLTTANINWTYGRDVEIPRTVLFEAGYRQLFGGNTVVDIAAYSKTNRNSLTYRRLPYQDPNTGGPLYINSLTNADYSLARGVDVRLDRRISEIADAGLSYSYIDARGTGSDPATYTDLLLRRNTNLSILTGAPVDPPELLLPLDQSRTHTLSGRFSLMFGADYAEGSPLSPILSDMGIFATVRVASGLPFTRLLNQANGQTGPPSDAGLEGQPAEALNASRMPAEKRFDLRITKGFEVAGRGARLFVDLRNPLGIVNTNAVYLETGSITNTRFRDDLFDAYLREPTLDGDNLIDDFVIADENAESALNRYMLEQAECRFGDCDGEYTVTEQRAALNAWYTMIRGPQTLVDKNQSLRLGIELAF
jgi:uncharacterized protein YkuJ